VIIISIYVYGDIIRVGLSHTLTSQLSTHFTTQKQNIKVDTREFVPVQTISGSTEPPPCLAPENIFSKVSSILILGKCTTFSGELTFVFFQIIGVRGGGGLFVAVSCCF